MTFNAENCGGSAVADGTHSRSLIGGLSRLVMAPFSWLHAAVFGPAKPASKQLAFTIAFVSLAAKMAKADGVAVGVETEAFETCFFVPESERANVMRVFHLAAQDVAGYDIYAERIATLLADEKPLLMNVFECLFNIAAADGVLHQSEEAFLKTVAEKFGLSDADYRTVRQIFVRDPDNHYLVLGVDPAISDEDLKTHYRNMVRENHPDKLAAKGLPQEFLVIADRKLAAINAAYDAIQEQRSLARGSATSVM